MMGEIEEWDHNAKPDESGQSKFVAKQVIKIEMAKRDMGYRELAAALAAVGVEIDEKVLRNKVARGTFSAAFLMTCMIAMQVKSLDLSQWTKSMDDVLADIRRIIAEDDEDKAAKIAKALDK